MCSTEEKYNKTQSQAWGQVRLASEPKGTRNSDKQHVRHKNITTQLATCIQLKENTTKHNLGWDYQGTDARHC